MSWNFDCLIVGAGFSGAVLAERLATQLEKKCLVVDRRAHIGGNAQLYEMVFKNSRKQINEETKAGLLLKHHNLGDSPSRLK